VNGLAGRRILLTREGEDCAAWAAELERLATGRHSETVHPEVAQVPGDLYRPVAVAVGLHRGQHAGAGFEVAPEDINIPSEGS